MARTEKAVQPQVGMAPEERAAAERKVLFPTTHVKSVMVGPHRLDLIPLVATKQRQVLDLVVPVLQLMADGEFGMKNLGETQDVLTRALVVIASMYDVPLTKEWIEDHLSSAQIQRAVEAQIEVGEENDFLLLNSRQFFFTIRGLLEATHRAAARFRAQIEEEDQKLLSMRASVNPGTSASPN